MTTAFFASIETTTAEETMQKENKIRNGNLSKTYSGKTSINEKVAEKDTVNSNYNENTERNKNVEKDIANTLKKGNKEARETKKITILGDKIIDWEQIAQKTTLNLLLNKSSMLESLTNPSNIIINVWINDSNQTMEEIASLTH